MRDMSFSEITASEYEMNGKGVLLHMHNEDICATQERYSSRFAKYGATPKALGWDKGKQDVRFDVLTSLYDFSEKSVLDIGCGFGDLLSVLNERASHFSYTGIDIVDDLVGHAKKVHPEFMFISGDFISYDFNQEFDYCIASGIFNHKLMFQDSYDFIYQAMQKALQVARDGFAFDFLSDKVDYMHEHTFHSSPSKILDLAFTLSRNVVLRNDYMPFEFSLFIFKDESFSVEDTLFSRYKRICEKRSVPGTGTQ
jgi:SAM-dependent methyltransferase